MIVEQLNNIQLINADCMDVLRELPDKSFDLAIVDPPYGIGASSPAKKPDYVKQRNGKILPIAQSQYGKKDWDKSTPVSDYFGELVRVSKNQIIFGINYFSNLYPFGAGRIVWDKMNGNCDQFGCEIAYYSGNNRTDIVHYMWRGMMQGVKASFDIRVANKQKGNKKLNEKRIHPCQKPVELYTWLLKRYAKAGDKILDTHLGSGSICLAADAMGFDLTGIELDTEYYNAAKERLLKQQAEPQLFATGDFVCSAQESSGYLF